MFNDPHRLQVRLWVNGTLMQNYSTSDMAHKIPRCIEWVSSIHPLEPGDVLACGTNHRGLNPFSGRGSDRARDRAAQSTAREDPR
jgi:2-keto-4-pentenoate hydratase/2-oxohepta-3-ene-1,7-dioic acid hydratase in catechol pathway